VSEGATISSNLELLERLFSMHWGFIGVNMLGLLVLTGGGRISNYFRGMVKM